MERGEEERIERRGGSSRIIHMYKTILNMNTLQYHYIYQ